MRKYTFWSMAVLTLFFTACEEQKNARIEVWLTDNPGDFQEVNIDLEAVEVNRNESDDAKGWTAIEAAPRVYNLLDLVNGQETLLGELDLPAGRLSQVRLKLGADNTVKVGDHVYPLGTPSAQQSGLKVNIHQVLAEGITYKILLDFDAAQSVVQTGAGSYILKPVIRAVAEAKDGAIKGKIDPPATVAISVFEGEELITTTASDESGGFLIRGLESGSYRLVFAGETADFEKDGVTVTIGAVTDVGAIEMVQ